MVEIPDDVAKQIATVLRAEHYAGSARGEWADLLDPQPPTLREQVAAALYPGEGRVNDYMRERADAVLAVVADAPVEPLIALVGPRFADWLAAQPLNTLNPGRIQRDADVALIRGGGTR